MFTRIMTFSFSIFSGLFTFIFICIVPLLHYPFGYTLYPYVHPSITISISIILGILFAFMSLNLIIIYKAKSKEDNVSI